MNNKVDVNYLKKKYPVGTILGLNFDKTGVVQSVTDTGKIVVKRDDGAIIELVDNKDCFDIVHFPKSKTLNVHIWCQASYMSEIPVPEDMTLEEAKQYAKENLDIMPIHDLEYLANSDELDEDLCFFDGGI